MRNQHIEETEEIRRFWRHLFGGQQGRLMVWTGIRGDDGKIVEGSPRSNIFNYPSADESAAQWALEKSAEGHEVYFCSHLLTGPERVKANAAEITALWGDLDGAAVPNATLTPTAVVESSPGRFHCYWRLKAAIPPAAAEQLNRRIADRVGADASGFDLTQLLRVPYTRNHKYQGEPVVEVKELLSSTSYAPGELERVLPAAGGEPEPNRGEQVCEGDEPPVALSEGALRVWRGEVPKVKDGGEVDKSKTLFAIGRVLYEAGANRRVVVEGLRERDEALGFRKYSVNRDGGKREYERIFEKLQACGRTQQKSAPAPKTAPKTAPKAAPKAAPEAAAKEWPVMGGDAYKGLLGEVVSLVSPHTEGDPVAVLVSAIVGFGNAIGRGPYVQIGATRHHTNLFAGIVGATAKGRKGSSWSPVMNILHAVDAAWVENRVVSGLSSGEGLIAEVRDPVHVVGDDGEVKVTDPGETDKRLLIVEGELAQPLKALKREGNTLSPVLRNGWDGETLRTLVKTNPYKATDPHMSILGHITIEELLRHLTETEMANGLANRFLWVLAKRSKSLPFGGAWHTVDLAPLTTELVAAVEFAAQDVRMEFADEAKNLWVEAYEHLTEERYGMFGAVTARAEAQALRLAMIYALLDLSTKIKKIHVESALEVWEYAEESARYIFGDSIGDPEADKVLTSIKRAGGFLTRTEVSNIFSNHKKKRELERIREVLTTARRINVTIEHLGADKPTEMWRLA